MKPEQALQLLDQVLANVNGTRADHVKLQEAILVLKEAIKKKEEIKK